MSDFISPIADAIVDKLNGLGVPDLTAHKWMRVQLPTVPCAMVQFPAARFTALGAADTHLGVWDVTTEWTVTIIVEVHGEVVFAQQWLADTMTTVAAAFAADPTIGGVVQDSALTAWSPVSSEEQEGRRFLAIEATVEVLDLRPSL